jgi:hypothetical protein
MRALIAFCIVFIPVFGFSQLRPLHSLSYIQEFSLDDRYLLPTFVHYSDPIRCDLVVYDSHLSELILLTGTGTGEFTGRKVLASIPLPSSIFIGNSNGDGIDDIALVLREQNKIIILSSIKNDSSYNQMTFSVDFYPERVVFGDITGDAITDLVIFGKLSPGVTVIRGKGRNAFHAPLTIFPSVPVSDFSIISLNDDKIPDVVIRKWLSNEDVFYFGIGNLQFSEQTTLAYGGDSVLSAFGDLNNDRITDVVVASTQLGTVLIYQGDGLGNLVRVQNVSLQNTAKGIYLGSLHSKESIDIVVQDSYEKNFSVIINKGSGQFFDEVIFGLPYDQNRLAFADINGDGFSELVVSDAVSPRYSVAWNARTVAGTNGDRKIIVGNTPSGVSVTDLNADGIDDILVSNSGSNTISVIMGNQRNGMLGQFTVETATSPTNVTAYSRNDSTLTLLTVHSNELLIGLITLNSEGKDRSMVYRDADLYTIPLSGRPSYVLPDLSIYNRSVSMYVFSKTIPNGITFYQQIQGTKFVAKNLTLQVPSRIIFSTISDLNGDGITDLIYLYHDQKNKRDVIGTTLNDVTGDFIGMSYAFVLPDTGLSRAYVYVDDMNGDQRKDFMIYDHGLRKISMILGKHEGDFAALVRISGEMTVENIHHIQILDFDADGINDILYRDAETSTVFLLKGKGNGTFFPKRRLLDIPADSVFRCGDVDGDGIVDLVYTIPKENSICIKYGD